MNDRKDAETLATAKDLTGALTQMAAEVKRLRKFGRTNRRFIVFDVLLTIALAATGAVSVHATQTASSASASNLALCQSSNVARAQQVELWDFVLSLSSGKPQTARQEKNVAEFRQHLEAIFAPRDCGHVSPGNP